MTFHEVGELARELDLAGRLCQYLPMTTFVIIIDERAG
jgi:hypothetical protein